MKILFFALFMTISLTIFSQEREATILFNDNTSIKGFGEIKREKIYFRVSLTDKISEWTYDMTYGLLFSGYGFSEKYVYVKPNKYDKPKLMEVIEEGKVNLYKESKYGANMGIGVSAGSAGFGTGPARSFDYSAVYYIKRKNEEYANDISFSFKSNSLRYFSYCKMLVEKIKNKEFKKNNIVEMIYFYNDYCGEEEEN